MKLRNWIAACTLGVAAFSASATLIPLTARLDGHQEAPQVQAIGQIGTQADLGGEGFAWLLYDDVSHVLFWALLFDLDTGPAVAAHFHGATNAGDASGVGLTSPVRIHIDGVTGRNSGLVIGSFDLDDLINSANNEANLLAGLWYINIHTAAFPSGEIRGQVLGPNVVRQVPEPLALSVVGLALLLLAPLRRRRARRPAG